MKGETESNFVHLVASNLHQQCGRAGSCGFVIGDCASGYYTFCLASAGVCSHFPALGIENQPGIWLWTGTNSWGASGKQEGAEHQVELCWFEPLGSQAPWVSAGALGLELLRCCWCHKRLLGHTGGGRGTGEQLGLVLWQVPGSGHWGSATGLVCPAQPQREGPGWGELGPHKG